MNEIDSILHSELRPFIADTKSDDYYTPLFRGLKIVRENFTPHYAITFPAPEFSAKVKYYKRLIDNSVTNELNRLFDALQDGGTDLILFRRKKLFEKIKSALDEIKRYIEQNQYDLATIISPHADFSVNTQHAECVYIFNYMLTALIRCYMEFQNHFIEHIEPDKRFEIADFFTQILKRQVPANTFIQHIAPIEIYQEQTKAAKPKIEKETVLAFVYSKLNTESSNITDLMNALKKNNYIAQDTSITDFKHAFSGVKVDNPIIWTEDKSALTFLIKEMMNKGVLSCPRNTHWKIVCSCFVDKNQNAFNPDNLRSQQVPKSKKDMIKRIANLL
jgi:hypothetical protein